MRVAELSQDNSGLADVSESEISSDKGSNSEKSEMRLSVEKLRGVKLGPDFVRLKVLEMNVENVGDEMGPSLEMVQGGHDEDTHRGGEVQAD